MKYIIPFILLAFVSCNKPAGNRVVDKDLVVKHQLMRGTVSNKDTTAVFEFKDCTCSLNWSGIIIRHSFESPPYFGLYLITHVHNDSVNFWLGSKSGYYGDSKKFHLQDSLLILTSKSYNFGDSVEGKIRVSGYSIDPDRNDQRVSLKIEGVFKCALSDSAFHNNEYENILGFSKH